MVSLLDYVEHFARFDTYVLFLLPIIRLIFILCVPLCLVIFINDFSFMRFLSIPLIIVLPFAVNFISYFHIINHVLTSVIITAFILLGALLFFYKFRILKKLSHKIIFFSFFYRTFVRLMLF